MAEVLPCLPFNPMARTRDHDSMDSGALCLPPPTYHSPEPNPPFVFPLEPENRDAGSSGRTPANPDRGLRPQPMNRSKPQPLSISPLPPFESRPSTSDNTPLPTTSPSRSPRKPPSLSIHAGGHRRNGSEFIGGDSRSGGQGLQSTSPTKGEGALPTPPSAITPPLGNRPRHAHRRSKAISSHDVSHITKLPKENRGSSAPTTPAMEFVSSDLQSSSENPGTKAVGTMSRENSLTPPRHRGTTSFEGLTRPRVGFSDTIEFIPRPLSTISSETSSSLSTILASHSVTGSITSIVSAGAPSPPSTKTNRATSDTIFARDSPQPRPRTASPTLSNDRDGLPSAETIVALERPWSSSAAERPLVVDTVSDSSVAVGSLSGGSQPHESDSSSCRLLSEDGEQDQLPRDFGMGEPSEPQTLRRHPPSSPGAELMRPRTSPEPKVVKRQRKVKSWADSILLRKAGRQELNDNDITRRPPTPPPPKPIMDDEFCWDDINFDEDTTCVIHTPIDHVADSPVNSTHVPTWNSRTYVPNPEPDDSTNVLDLDAVIGTRPTTDVGADADDTTSRAFSVARRRMHSSGATGGFSGPGMHYHRRADSLPEMAAINYHTFGFPSLGVNPVMADVFEEEEDDDKHPLNNQGKAVAQEESNSESCIVRGLGVDIGDIGDQESTAPVTKEVKGCDEAGQSLPPTGWGHEIPNSTPRSEVAPEEFGAIEIVNADEEPRGSDAAKVTNKSTLSPVFPIDSVLQRPASAPIDFAIRRFGLAYATPDSSCVSSPDFNRTSFDTPRMHTANSSITDRATLGSCRTGETGLSMRGSVDDVPSLTSSASMVSARPPRFLRQRGNRTDVDLPSSLTERGNGVQGTASKRSSLASLSRLVGSSYGEKSKLHIEEHVSPDISEKTEKKKGNRISRLMRFWKSKEKLSAS